MHQNHWILDTRPSAPVHETVAFSGFLYNCEPSTYKKHIKQIAKCAPNTFLSTLNGSFCGFVQVEDRIFVFNDRYGYGKIYWTELQDGIVAGSSFNDVVRKLAIRTPDTTGILEFLRFGYPLYDRTLVDEVRLLPPASFVEIDRTNGKPILKTRYWHYCFEENLTTDQENMKTDLWENLSGAVSDCFADPKAVYAVGNSGGLDSRSVLAIACEQGFDFTAYTFGAPESDAIYIANKIAKTMGVRQENIDIGTDFLPKYWEIHQERRPMTPLSSTWYYSGREQLGGCTVNVTGLFGDNTLGIHKINKYLKMQNAWDLYNLHSLDEDVFFSTLTPLSFAKVGEHFQSTLSMCAQPDYIKQFDQWNFENRQCRFIMQEGWVSFLDEMEMRSPFTNNKLVDFAFSLPFEWRRDRKLYQAAIASRFPKLNRIRYERASYAMNDPHWLRIGRAIAWRFGRLAERHTGWNPYFRGNHKHQRQWLLTGANYSFFEEHIRRPNYLFKELFHAEHVAANVRSLLESNWGVASNLLTIKLWLEHFIE